MQYWVIRLTLVLLESVALTWKLKVPVSPALPLIFPALFNVTPGGSPPKTSE